MRQSHAGGQKLFVDYAGDRVEVFDQLTGEARLAWMFVAVMGAPSFTYAEASWTQGLADWIDAHTRAFEAMGGVNYLIGPDSTKTTLIKACPHELVGNRTYAELAAHYGIMIPGSCLLGRASRATKPRWERPG